MGKFRWTKKLFEFYRESLDWRNTNTPKYGKLRNAIIWFPRGCGTWNFQNILTTCCSKCIHNFKQFCYYNQHLVHGISHILSSCEPSSRKKRFRLSTSRLVACDNGADFPTCRRFQQFNFTSWTGATELVPYPAWGGEYNDILQSNTCSIDNILAIISSNKTTITKSLELIGTTPCETKLYRIFELASDCKFEKLRDFIAQEIGLEITIESLGWIKSYNFFGSEGYFVNYLRTKDLCNDKYFTNFKCHQCINTFDTMSKISSIGNVTDNIESSVNRDLIPCKCKSCGSTTTIFERLSGQF